MDMNKLNGIETRFLDALQRTYQAYVTHGARSPEKLKILHGWIRNELTDILGDEYIIMSLSEIPNISEQKQVQGRYYAKNVNISVSKNNIDVGIINVSFVNSNFRQNAGNYFENQLGETANLRSNDIIFGRLFCITEPIPYYNNNNRWLRNETIKDTDIQKYNRLATDRAQLHAPDILGFCIAKVDLPNRVITGWATEQDLQEMDVDNYKIISDEMDIRSFFTNFAKKVEAKSQQSRLRKFFNCFLQKIIDVCHFFKK